MRAKVLLDLVAKKLFLTKGMGVHEDKLTSFEYALRNAGIAGTNLVLISSIFPPGAKLISRTAGLKLIKPGQILFTIYSKNQTNEPRRHITASVGIAQPKDKSRYGPLLSFLIPTFIDVKWNTKRGCKHLRGNIFCIVSCLLL